MTLRGRKKGCVANYFWKWTAGSHFWFYSPKLLGGCICKRLSHCCTGHDEITFMDCLHSPTYPSCTQCFSAGKGKYLALYAWVLIPFPISTLLGLMLWDRFFHSWVKTGLIRVSQSSTILSMSRSPIPPANALSWTRILLWLRTTEKTACINQSVEIVCSGSSYSCPLLSYSLTQGKVAATIYGMWAVCLAHVTFNLCHLILTTLWILGTTYIYSYSYNWVFSCNLTRAGFHFWFINWVFLNWVFLWGGNAYMHGGNISPMGSSMPVQQRKQCHGVCGILTCTS